MRTVISFLASLGVIFGITSMAHASYHVGPMPAKENSCQGALVERTIYISGSTYDRYIIDEMWSNTDRFIAQGGTQILYWESGSNLLSGCKTPSAWSRLSEVSPGNNIKVVAYGATCRFHKPTNPNNKHVQFVFKINHGQILSDGTHGTQTKEYKTVSGGNWQTHYKSYQNYRVANYELHANECLNITLAWCGDGIVSHGEQCDPAAPGQSSATCDPVTCKPIAQQNPICLPARTGPQTAPLTGNEQLCQVGTTSGFTATQNGNTTNYSWACNAAGRSVACTANYTKPTGEISIKKYAGDRDGQTAADALPVTPGTDFTYTYVVKNGTTASNRVTVTDTFPFGVQVRGFDAPAGWTCNRGTKTIAGKIYHTAVCHTPSMAPNTEARIVVHSHLDYNYDGRTSLRNIAYVCRDEDTPTGNCNPDCVDPNDPNCTPPTPPVECSTIPGHPHYDPACIVPHTPPLDLAIKKYINSHDAQPTDPVSLSPGSSFNYIMKVQNVGSVTATGTTTVKDILPSGVEHTANPTGSAWQCAYDIVNRTMTCTTQQQVQPGQYFSDITFPVRVSAGNNARVRNDATVHNPNEGTNGCYPDNRMPSGNETEQNCTRDPRNTDPAVFTTPGGGGGGKTYYVPTCVSPTATTCSARGYTDHATCRSSNNNAQCYETLADCNANKDTPGANVDRSPSYCKPSDPGGPPSPPGYTPYCGNGILEPNEECDPGTGRGPNNSTAYAASPWCNQDCKVRFQTTNPGENPITDIWMTIPTMDNTTRLGYSWLDGQPGKIKFQENRVVIGKNSPVFTVVDTVGLGISTKYNVPLQLEANKKFCLTSTGSALGNNSACTTVGDTSSVLDKWTQPNGGQTYVVLGRGDYLVPIGSGQYQVRTVSNTSDSITLFHGNKQYGSKSLRDTFMGQEHGETTLALEVQLSRGSMIDLVKMPVLVSSARVGTTTTPVNRLSGFTTLTRDEVLRQFLDGGLKINRNTSTSRNVNNTTATGTAITPIRADITAAAPTTDVTAITALPIYRGNSQIRAVKGNVTIACPAGKTVFEMTGVQTILVEGNITFKCNVGYPSGDTKSSWAWIAKGGNIEVYNGQTNVDQGAITNLAGVYVAINENGNGGEITHDPKGRPTTATILRIDGTMYGDATKLFNSRTYARGTSSYDILTTGTVLTYSSRALANPPPLLSQYLNSYKIQRVIR